MEPSVLERNEHDLVTVGQGSQQVERAGEAATVRRKRDAEGQDENAHDSSALEHATDHTARIEVLLCDAARCPAVAFVVASDGLNGISRIVD